MSASLPGKWMSSEVPADRVCLRADSFVALRMAAEQGLGLALLPSHIGDGSRRLKQLGQPLPELNVGLWILTHDDLIRTARIRVFIDYISSAIGGRHTH